MTARLSVVIPVYNSAGTIPSLVDQLAGCISGIDSEILLIDDGSADGSADICARLCGKYPGLVSFVALSKNFGEHNAVMAGLSFTTGDYVVVMDDDFQNPPSEALRIFEYASRGNYDVVYARYAVKNHSSWRNVGSRFTNAVARRLLGVRQGLYLSSFKCLSRFVVNETIKYRGPFPYVDGLALRTTDNIGVMESVHASSRKRHSGYTVIKLGRLWLNMVLNFSVLPLRLSSIIGMFLSVAGAALTVAVVVEKILYPETPVGWASLIVVVMLFSGVQLVMLGVIGEYVGHLFLGANGTPQFVVRETIGCEGRKDG